MVADTMSIKTKQTEIIGKLHKLIRQERLWLFITSFMIPVLVVLFTFMFFSILESLFNFSSGVRTALIIFLAVETIVCFVFLLFRRLILLFKKITLREYVEKAYQVGRKNPAVKDEFANVISLVNDESNAYSMELIEASFNNIVEKLNGKDFEVDAAKLKNKPMQYFILILSALIFMVSIPQINEATFRLINYGKDFEQPPKFVIKIIPKKITVTKGDSLAAAISVIGESPTTVNLFVKDDEHTDFIKVKKLRLNRNEGKYKFHKILRTFTWFASAENISSDTAQVKVINPPVIKSFSVTVKPPNYTGEKPFTFYDNGNIRAIKGSRIVISGTANKQLDTAWIAFGNNRAKPLNCKLSEFAGEFRLMNNGSYKIRVKDNSGNMNRFPIVYSLEVNEDTFPTIKVIEPEKETELGNEDTLPVLLKITDDYGFTKLELRYRLTASEFKKPEEKFHSLKLPINKKITEQNIFYEWNLRDMNIEVNDRVNFYFVLFDNDFISGPKFVKSEIFSLFLPPLEEFLSKTEKKQNASIDKLKKTLTEAKKLKEEFKQLSNELKKNKTKISWEEKKKIETAARKMKELAKKSEELKKEIINQKKELSKKNILSKETLKKYDELQKLMSKLDNDLLKKALEKMQNKLENMMRTDAQQALEELKKNEEAFKKSLERTIELFKRILAEQKIDELVKRSTEIEKEQEKINKEEAADSLGTKKDELTKKQSDLSQRLKELEKKAKELSDMMNQMEDMPKDEMEKLAKELSEQKNPELSKKAAEQMMTDKMSEAAKNQNKLMQNMKQMTQMMMNMQSMMKQQSQQKVMAEMMQLIKELVNLSRQQEALKAETNSGQLNNEQSRKLAEKQNRILNSIDIIFKQMSSLSKKTFAVTPEMGNALGKAKKQMRNSISSALDMNGRKAIANQKSAMAALNDAANMMQQMMNDMANQQGGGGGMMSLSQQLKQMAGQQMQLNQMTNQMKGKGMSMQQAAAMRRLAGEQAALRKSLEELNREAKASGKSKKIASNLEKILSQMKEVVTDLQSNNLNEDLIKTQQNILSRLLDAQRSVNERDFEKNRESQSGKIFKGLSPAQLSKNKGEEKSKLEKELLKAMDEGYSREYRELIREYYKKLKEK